MRETGIDQLLLGTPDNIRYVCDYRSLIINETADHMVCIFHRDKTAHIFCPHIKDPITEPDPANAHVTALKPLAGWTPLMAEPQTATRSILEDLKANGTHRVGYDGVNPNLVEALREGAPSNMEFVPVGYDLFELRRQKTPSEIDLMRLANQDNLQALEGALGSARPGMRDRDLLAVALSAQQRSRAELITHFTCNIHLPFGNWFPLDHTIDSGEAIFLDQCYYGLGGYSSDITRTVFVGREPTKEVAQAYRRLVEVQREVASSARAGTEVAYLDELGNETLTKSGLTESPYGWGHGIGLRIMEPPSLAPARLLDNPHRKLRNGEVIALEPETSVEVKGHKVVLKVEDCFLVGESDLEPLGSLPSIDPVVVP